jgi:hypothetical protein
MKQKEIIKKIGTILKELQDQHEFIEKIKEPINDLELELFVANGHFLNDHIDKWPASKCRYRKKIADN